MSKWPALDDREWPIDMPAEYFIPENWGRRDIYARGLASAVIGLARRVEALEAELGKAKRQIADDSMSAALRESERLRRW